MPDGRTKLPQVGQHLEVRGPQREMQADGGGQATAHDGPPLPGAGMGQQAQQQGEAQQAAYDASQRARRQDEAQAQGNRTILQPESLRGQLLLVQCRWKYEAK